VAHMKAKAEKKAAALHLHLEAEREAAVEAAAAKRAAAKLKAEHSRAYPGEVKGPLEVGFRNRERVKTALQKKGESGLHKMLTQRHAKGYVSSEKAHKELMSSKYSLQKEKAVRTVQNVETRDAIDAADENTKEMQSVAAGIKEANRENADYLASSHMKAGVKALNDMADPELVAKASFTSAAQTAVGSNVAMARSQVLGGMHDSAAMEAANREHATIQSSMKMAENKVSHLFPDKPAKSRTVNGINPYSMVDKLRPEEFVQIPDGTKQTDKPAAKHFSKAERQAQTSAKKEEKLEDEQNASQAKRDETSKQKAAAAVATAAYEAEHHKPSAASLSTKAAEAAAQASVQQESQIQKQSVQDAETAAQQSASTAELMTDQQQVVRDVKFLPGMSEELHRLSAELSGVSRRNKYGADVAAAISKGLDPLLGGKDEMETESLVEVAEGATFYKKMTDGMLKAKADMANNAYAQSMQWQNDRTKAIDAAQAAMDKSTMDVQQQQAAALAIQQARDHDADRVAVLNEIKRVHRNYEKDLGEAKNEAKQRAMATLQNFAKSLKQEKELGETYNVKAASEHAEKVAPKMKKIHMPAAVKFARKGEKSQKIAKVIKSAQKAKVVTEDKPDTPAPASFGMKEIKQTLTAAAKSSKAPEPRMVPKKADSPTRTPAALQSKQAMDEAETAEMKAIAQAGTERALVDTAKKIRAMKAKIKREVGREKKYFMNKEKEEYKNAHEAVAGHKKQIVAMDKQAENNLAREETRLHKDVHAQQEAMNQLKKVKAAALQEKAGIEKTEAEATQMKHDAETVESDLQEQLVNYKQQVDRVDHISDLGEVQTIQGNANDPNLGENMQLTDDVTLGDVTPGAGAAKIEAKDEAATNNDLKQIKVLEDTALKAGKVFKEAAETTVKESVLAEGREQKIADKATLAIQSIKADIEAGTAIDNVAKKAETNVDDAAKTAKAEAAARASATEEKTDPSLYEGEKYYTEEGTEEVELGESASVTERTQHVRHFTNKLKAEQFALVNAQTKLNRLRALRKRKETALANKWGHLEKNRAGTEVTKLRTQMHQLSSDTDKEIKATTKVDTFLVTEKKEEKKERKIETGMKKVADQSVHDEFIASKDSKKALVSFKKFTETAAGLLDNIHNPDLVKVLGQGKDKDVSTVAAVPREQDAEDKQKDDMSKFVQAHGGGDAKIDETKVQPTAAKANEALQQEKKDEKIAGEYGKHMEHEMERKMGKPADMKGDGVIGAEAPKGAFGQK